MSLKTSTGLRNKLLDTGALAQLLAGGFLQIYSGQVPATADDAVGAAVLLGTVQADGADPLTFDAAVNGVMAKNSSQVWSVNPVAEGAASFYRHVGPADTGAISTTEARIQGTVGTLAADMLLSDATFMNGVPKQIDYYVVGIAAL